MAQIPFSKTVCFNSSNYFLGLGSVVLSSSGKVIFLVILAVLIFYRAPNLLLEPRFWAEEASLFFRYAYQNHLLDSLVFVPKRTAGYFLLVANIPAAIAANFFPIEYAPFVTTYFALIIQIIPFLIILWGRSYIWDSALRKVVACLIVLFAPSSIGEVWLNTINAQVYCGLISFCILCEVVDKISWYKRLFYKILLAFCTLSGVYTTFLFPVFCYKAWFERSRESLIHSVIVFILSFVQLTIFVWLYYLGHVSPKKLVGFDWARAVISVFFNQIGSPLLGYDGARSLVAMFDLQNTLLQNYETSVGLVLLLCIAVVFYILIEYRLRSPRLLLIGSFLSLALCTSVFAMGGTPGGRYAVLSGMVLLFLVLDNIRFRNWLDLKSLACIGLLCIALVIGVNQYKTYKARVFFICAEGCPKWSEEIQKWKGNPDYQLTVWPYPRWKFHLPRR